jgi:hypothetical protein
MKRLLPLFLAFFATACRKDSIEVRHVPKEEPPAGMAMGMGGGGGMDMDMPMERPAGLKWSVPTGWKELPGNGMRLATFELPQGSGKAEGSVVALAGDAGGELANVNRWRGQLTLPPIAENDLSGARTRVHCSLGDVLVYDFVGTGQKKSRLVAGMIQVSGTMWFFKLTGDESSVGAAKPAFLKFLQGLKNNAN